MSNPAPYSAPFRLSRAIALAIAAAGVACGGSSGTTIPPDDAGGQPSGRAPAAPSELAATGSLHNIHLSWTASPGASGYHVYRSADDGAAPIRLTRAPVTATTYDDAIASPAGDGVLYSYQVTAVGDGESAPSNAATTMHGTRLAADYPGAFTTRRELSPYVAEHRRTTVSTFMTVEQGTALYVLDGTVIDFITRGRDEPIQFDVRGLIRATPSAAAPATITAHHFDGSALIDGEGFQLVFRGVPYNPADGSGSLLTHVRLENLAQAFVSKFFRGGMAILTGGLRIHDAKLIGSNRDGSCRLAVQNGAWVILDDSYLDRVTLDISGDVRATPFSVTRNVVRHSDSIVTDVFSSTEAVAPGQIAGNDLDGARSPRVSTTIPAGNNYWAGGLGTPPVPSNAFPPDGYTAALSNPGPPLASAPAAGPDW